MASVSRIVQAGHRVVFQPDEWGGNYMEDLATGKPVVVKPRGKWKRIYERNGKYVMPTWLTPKQPTEGRLAPVTEPSSPNSWQAQKL